MWQFILARVGLSVLILGLGFVLVAQIGLSFSLGSSWQNIVQWAILILYLLAFGLAWSAYWQVALGIVVGVLVLVQVLIALAA
jgi:hypothetical protein